MGKKYKVLWVEDQEFPSLINHAKEETQIELEQVRCWAEAETRLVNDFDNYSAIILDCECKLTREDKENGEFLSEVMPRLTRIAGNRYLPWFVLSAGIVDNFENIIKFSLNKDRKNWDPDWEQIYYSKTGVLKDGTPEYEILLQHVERAAAMSKSNKIKELHRVVFGILKRDDLGIDEHASEILLNALVELNDNSADFNPEPHYNQLRQFAEYIFRSCNKIGLLPDEFIEAKGVNLSQSSFYLSGKNPQKIKLRYGEWRSKDDYDRVFPPQIEHAVWDDILNITSKKSHTGNKYKSRYELFSIVMQMCHFVEWYGVYSLEHDNRDANLSMCRPAVECDDSSSSGSESMFANENSECDSLKGKTVSVERDEHGNIHSGKILFNYNKCANLVGKQVVITGIRENDKRIGSTEKYEFFCYGWQIVEGHE